MPSQPLVLVDLMFGDGTEPAFEAVLEVLGHSGRIVHTYNLNAVRAIMRPSAISALGVTHARGVTDAADFRVRVSVGLRDHGSAGVFTGRGGRVLWLSSNAPPSLFGTIDDHELPALRRNSEVRYVEHESFICPGD